ncbi:Hypp422 [Branchiostoma lanceolatum]|uniref:Hypp422 protein n=1 Tax=Branchiostoma lanceolatum TaxID=7740 RepID=A0A8J9VLZ1_BRALA|nr:Hypp422 [Branchiostoma lanceolatum]
MFAAPLTAGEAGQGMPTQRQWNTVLRLFGAMIAITGVAVAIAVMVMANKGEEANRFPWEGVVLFSVGLIMVLFSLYYTDPEGGGRRTSCVVRRESDMMVDQPPAYWEVCDLSDSPPDYIEPTSVTSGNGEIVVTITRVKSTPPGAAAVNVHTAAVNMEEPYRQQSDEEPDEPLPSYEDVVTLEENERRERTSSV